jgi:hypothetical protein
MLRLMTDAAAQQTLAARASRFAQALPDVSAAGAVFARLLIRSLAVPDRQVMAEAAPAHRPGNPGHGTGGCLLPA